MVQVSKILMPLLLLAFTAMAMLVVYTVSQPTISLALLFFASQLLISSVFGKKKINIDMSLVLWLVACAAAISIQRVWNLLILAFAISSIFYVIGLIVSGHISRSSRFEWCFIFLLLQLFIWGITYVFGLVLFPHLNELSPFWKSMSIYPMPFTITWMLSTLIWYRLQNFTTSIKTDAE